MKKFLSFAMVAFMVLALASCGAKKDENGNVDPATASAKDLVDQDITMVVEIGNAVEKNDLETAKKKATEYNAWYKKVEERAKNDADFQKEVEKLNNEKYKDEERKSAAYKKGSAYASVIEKNPNAELQFEEDGIVVTDSSDGTYYKRAY